MTRVLAIETMGEYLGLSLLIETQGKISVRSLFQKKPLQQSDKLIPTLDRFLRRQRLTGSQVDVWAVDIGPGSFTGVRLGVAAARALAQGFGKPLLGVSSLEAMAAAWRTKKTGLIAAVYPALHGEVYAGVYESGENLSCLVKPQWSAGSVFDSQVRSLRRRFPGRRFFQTSQPPHPEMVARIAHQRYSKYPSALRFHYNKVVPLYLQPSWAERAKPHAARP